MKLIISIVIVYICLFPASESSAEYHPIPEIIDATTEPAIDGHFYKFHAIGWPDPYGRCATDQEAADWIALDPLTHWVDKGGPCKMCSSLELRLVTYNGSEVCMGDNPCPNGTILGNYYGEDGCMKCPEDYEFSDGLCRWNGVGPPPPPPPPSVPTGLSTGKYEICEALIISWYESNVETDYYILERSSISSPQSWSVLKKVDRKNPPGIEIKYYDKTVRFDYEYYYRVKACNQETGECSGYTPSERGFADIECCHTCAIFNSLLLQ